MDFRTLLATFQMEKGFFQKKTLQIFSIFINFSNTTVNSEPVRFPAWLKWNRSSVKSRLSLVAEFFQKNSYI
jgi:hypothetical protein